MFTNLIKYDLKFIFKTVNVYITLLFISVILYNLTSYDYTPTILDANGQVFGGDPDAPIFIQILHSISYNAVIVMLVALILNAIVRTWIRFKSSIYGDESYLTHTLPVSRQTLWLSKLASLIIVVFSVIISITISFCILSLTSSGKNLISSLGFDQHAPVSYTFTFLFCIFVEFLFIILCGITGIIIGNRSNRHRNLYSILFGFAIYSLSALFLLGYIFLWSCLDSSIQSLFTIQDGNPNDIFTPSFITKILLGISFAYTIMSIILVLINNKLLKQGVDVD